MWGEKRLSQLSMKDCCVFSGYEKARSYWSWGEFTSTKRAVAGRFIYTRNTILEFVFRYHCKPCSDPYFPRFSMLHSNTCGPLFPQFPQVGADTDDESREPCERHSQCSPRSFCSRSDTCSACSQCNAETSRNGQCPSSCFGKWEFHICADVHCCISTSSSVMAVLRISVSCEPYRRSDRLRQLGELVKTTWSALNLGNRSFTNSALPDFSRVRYFWRKFSPFVCANCRKISTSKRNISTPLWNRAASDIMAQYQVLQVKLCVCPNKLCYLIFAKQVS